MSASQRGMASPLASDSSLCYACQKAVPSDGRVLSCSECHGVYHLAPTCAGVADATFNTMGKAKRESWVCPKCRAKKYNKNSSFGGVGTMTMINKDNLTLQLSAINDKLHVLLPLKEKVDELTQLPAKMNDLLTVKVVVETLNETMRGLEKSLEFFSGQYDSLLAQVKVNVGEIKGLKSEACVLTSAVTEQRSEIRRLQAELNDSDQYSRLSNMEIHGLPYKPTENVRDLVDNLASSLNIKDFQPSDIITVHRLPPKKDSNFVPPVIVRFNSVTNKETWMASRGKLRSLPGFPILYFNENLTRINKELFWKARSRGKEKQYQFVWVKNAKIFAKKKEGSPVIRVNSVSDIDKMV